MKTHTKILLGFIALSLLFTGLLTTVILLAFGAMGIAIARRKGVAYNSSDNRASLLYTPGDRRSIAITLQRFYITDHQRRYAVTFRLSNIDDTTLARVTMRLPQWRAHRA